MSDRHQNNITRAEWHAAAMEQIFEREWRFRQAYPRLTRSDMFDVGRTLSNAANKLTEQEIATNILEESLKKRSETAGKIHKQLCAVPGDHWHIESIFSDLVHENGYPIHKWLCPDNKRCERREVDDIYFQAILVLPGEGHDWIAKESVHLAGCWHIHSRKTDGVMDFFRHLSEGTAHLDQNSNLTEVIPHILVNLGIGRTHSFVVAHSQSIESAYQLRSRKGSDPEQCA